MIKYINAREISRSSSVKIRSHPGATTEDLINYVRPTARKKLKMMVIHTAPICNLCPDLKYLFLDLKFQPRFVIFLPRFAISKAAPYL